MGTTVYWHKNQVIVRLKTQLTHHSLGTPPIEPIQYIIGKLRDAFKEVLKDLPKPVDMQFIEHQELCPSTSSTADSLDSAIFYRINPQTQTDMGAMQGDDGTAGMGDDDRTLDVIAQLENHKALLTALRNEGLSVESADAIPHWFNAGTNGTNFPTQGCPISPPIPVEESGASGRWKLQFSQLPDTLKNATGKDVSVLVLDTLPAPDQISRAADQAGSSNMLLQEMTKGMSWEEPLKAVPPAINFKSQFLPDVVEETSAERVVTGKDIYGRHVGFPMEDHGLFVAGIVRDLAPEATIECVRVLNDFGVGDIRTLNAALIDIRKRMSPPDPHSNEPGDLYKKPVVINLSLVVLPPEDDIPEGVTDATLKATQSSLYSLLQCLADQGAIFVAAAGNDSDPRMNASEKRFGPRYPAALGSDHHAMTAMISVGAVNRNRQAAKYSNYPGPYGIATYGGDLPKPDPWLPLAMDHVVARVDTNEIDALCGVYTAAQYPALSRNDPESEYPAPNSSAWAYWSGTSFATPIISALAARILQGRDPKNIDVRQAILDSARDEVTWTTVGQDGKDIPGPMIIAEQK